MVKIFGKDLPPLKCFKSFQLSQNSAPQPVGRDPLGDSNHIQGPSIVHLASIASEQDLFRIELRSTPFEFGISRNYFLVY